MPKKLTLLFIFSLFLSACTNVFFQPLKQHVASPDQYKIEYEDIYLNSNSNTKLHGWWFPGPEHAKANILFLHGNGQNISSHSGLIHWLTQHQYNVFIFDYRGYGKSEGKAEINGIITDINIARDYVRSRTTDAQKMFVIGHSLGASLGIHNLAHYPNNVDGMIFVSPFSNYRKIAQEVLSKSWLTWLIQWPASFTVSSDYDPIDAAGMLPNLPKLFLYSNTDDIVESHHVIDLFNQATAPKYKQAVKGHHNNIFAQPETQKAIVKYLDGWSEIK